jgi:hypothetical protein
MENLNERIFELNDEGLTAGKIAQKLRVKKDVVLDVLGEAANKGAGDLVEAFTAATGIKAVVDALTDDCGCKARKEALNEVFPNRKLRDLQHDQYAYLEGFFAEKKTSVSSADQKALVEIYNWIFISKRVISNCSPCVVSVINELKKIYERASNIND